MKDNSIQIAIDGPASSGKSTIAKLLADKYHLFYVDTGAMYRTLTYLALKNKINIDDEQALTALLKEVNITFKRAKDGQDVFANGEKITKKIREHEVTNNVSVVS